MTKQVKCPVCGRRLFDTKSNSTGTISIKCSQCKQVAEIELEKSVVCR